MIVNVSITSQRLTKKIEQVPVIISQSPGLENSWNATPPAVDIEVTGRSEIISNIDYGDVMSSVNADLPFIPGVTNEVAVMIHFRQGLNVDSARVVPEKIKLTPAVSSAVNKPEAVSPQPAP
jgi:YbbR domain-containing protein